MNSSPLRHASRRIMVLIGLGLVASLAACSSSPSTNASSNTQATTTTNAGNTGTTTTAGNTGTAGNSGTTTTAGNTGTSTTAGGGTAAPTDCSGYPGSTLSALGGTWSAPLKNNIGNQILCLYNNSASGGSGQATLTFTPGQTASGLQSLVTQAESSGQLQPSSVTPLNGIGQAGFQTSQTGFSPAPCEVWVLTSSGLAISLEAPAPLSTVISIVKTIASKY